MVRWLALAVLFAGCVRHISAAEDRAERAEDPHDWFRRRLSERRSRSPLAFAWAPSRTGMTACGKAYVVAIAEDGTVEFWGDANTREKGYHAWTMPQARLEKLKARALEPDIAEPQVSPAHGWRARIDATPPCVSVSSWREPLLCFTEARRDTLDTFLRTLDFESNAVQRIGEPQQDCDLVDLVVVDPEPAGP